MSIDAPTLQRMNDSGRSNMPEYVDADVNTLRDSSSDNEITLLLGVSGDRDELATRAEQVGGLIEGKLGRATLRVTAPESVVDGLCELEGLKSIELDREDVR